MKRVVVTGMGLVTPLGCGLEYPWKRLLECQSGIRSIDRFDTSDLPAKIAGQLPLGGGEGELDRKSTRLNSSHSSVSRMPSSA